MYIVDTQEKEKKTQIEEMNKGGRSKWGEVFKWDIFCQSNK